MADFPHLPLWTDAYIADTAHLTNEEHGVYLRLLMFAWRTPGCCLPDDDKRLALMVGVTPKKWATLRAVVGQFFTVEGGVWRQKRLTAEREFVEAKTKSARAAAAARWSAKQLENKEPGDAAASQQHMPDGCREDATHTHTHTHIEKREANASPKKRGTRLPDDWELPSEWADWAAVDHGMTDERIRDESERFRDYWRSAPGQRGVKLDWFATWRNWCRNSRGGGRSASSEVDRIVDIGRRLDRTHGGAGGGR